VLQIEKIHGKITMRFLKIFKEKQKDNSKRDIIKVEHAAENYVTVLSHITEEDLDKLLTDVRSTFPELCEWELTIIFGNINSYAKVEATRESSLWPTRRIATVIINSKKRHYTREAVKGLIAHELVHVLYIDRDYPHTEKDVAEEVIYRGYHRGIAELFIFDCQVPCNGRIKKVIGGIECRYYCPYGYAPTQRLNEEELHVLSNLWE